MGDDWPDLTVMRRAAIACAPPGAHDEVRAMAHHVTTRTAGDGAAREFCDLLLMAHGVYAAELDKTAKDYPYSTLIVNKTNIDSTTAAMAAVPSEYIPQLQYGKFDDPAAAVAEMRQKLKDVGYEDARASIQADMDAWKAARGL